MPDSNEKKIKKFFDITKELSDAKIIRSSKYLGDIGEYLAKVIYKIKLEDNQRNSGFDGIDEEGKKYQIKINNSTEKTNQDIGKPECYDYLILLVTSDSLLYDSKYSNQFICVYRIENKSLEGKKYIAKRPLHGHTPEYLINDDLRYKKNPEYIEIKYI